MYCTTQVGGNKVNYENHASNSQRGSKGGPWLDRSSSARKGRNNQGNLSVKHGKRRSKNDRSRGTHSRGLGYGRSKPKGDDCINAMLNKEEDDGGYKDQSGYD